MCVMTHSNIGLEYFQMCAMNHRYATIVFIHTWDLTLSYVEHNSVCVTWLSHVWDTSDFICRTWLVRIRNMTHLYVGHVWFMCGTWRSPMWDIPLSYVEQDLFIRHASKLNMHAHPHALTHTNTRTHTCTNCTTYVNNQNVIFGRIKKHILKKCENCLEGMWNILVWDEICLLRIEKYMCMTWEIQDCNIQQHSPQHTATYCDPLQRNATRFMYRSAFSSMYIKCVL